MDGLDPYAGLTQADILERFLTARDNKRHRLA
jgi:hypothetical protein